MSAELDQMLARMQLSEHDFVNRFRELSKLTELVIRQNEPMPLDAWVPAIDGITDPWKRSRGGFDCDPIATSVGAELQLSLDRALPRGYVVTGVRLEYAANNLTGTSMVMQLVRGTRAAGTQSFGPATTLPTAPTAAFTHMSAALPLTAPISAMEGIEQFVFARIISTSAGGLGRVKTLYLDYSYRRSDG